MEPWMWAVVLKPLGLIILFGFTFIIARWLNRVLPDSRLKRFLFIRWTV